MSVPNPTPNNLTLVRFGPLSVDFSRTGTYTLGQLEYDQQTFIPTASFVVYQNAIGTSTTQAVVAIDNGTTGENISTATLPATPVSTSLSPTGNLSQTVFTPATNGYVLGKVPVSTVIPSNGAAATQRIRVNVTTAASLQTLGIIGSRRTVNNISTLTNSVALPAGLIAGSQVTVKNAGNAAYNGYVTVISTTANSFSYYNPSLANEASTSDLATNFGAIVGDVYVVGLLQ